MAVNLDDGGIYHGVFAVGIGIEGLKDLGENPAFNPTAVTLEYAVPVAKFGRQIAPWAAGTDNPQDGFDKETVIGCFAGVACLAAAQRLYFGPLGICQDISASHGTMLSGNYVCQQALDDLDKDTLVVRKEHLDSLIKNNTPKRPESSKTTNKQNEIIAVMAQMILGNKNRQWSKKQTAENLVGDIQAHAETLGWKMQTLSAKTLQKYIEEGEERLKQ